MFVGEHPRIIPPTLLRVLSHKSGALPVLDMAATVEVALQRLIDRVEEALIITQAGSPRGLFSAHDASRFLLNGGTRDAPIHTAMSPLPTSGRPDDALEDWLQKMETENIRYLPVIGDGKILGILSRAELLAESDAHHRRVCQAIDLDHRIMFKRGTYSC